MAGTVTQKDGSTKKEKNIVKYSCMEEKKDGYT